LPCKKREGEIKKHLEVAYPFAIVFIVSLVIILDPGEHLSVFENKTIDARYRFYASPTSHTKDIIILEITEESIKRLEPVYGRWPWPRSVHGEVIEYLKADGAKAIGFDIIFSEHAVRREVDSETVNELRSFAQNADIPEVRSELLHRLDLLKSDFSDSQFVSAVEKAGNVFLPSVFYVDENDISRNPELGSDESSTLNIKSAFARSSIPISNNDFKNIYFNATIPFGRLATASRGIGHINYSPDKDGTCRRFFPLMSFHERGTAYPAFSLLIASYVKGVSPNEIKIHNGKIFISDSAIPIFIDGSAYIHYQGGEITRDREAKNTCTSFYQYIPYDYVLASKDLIETGKEPLIQAGQFKDKIVLISASAAGLTDLRPTPFSPVTPGIEIHANIIDNILSNKFLYPLNKDLEKLYIFLLAGVIAVASRFSGPYRGFFIVAIFVSSVAFFHWTFFEKGYVLPIIKPVLAMTFVYIGILLMKYVMEYRERKYLKSAFGYYIAPAVLEDILKSPDKLKLGGERKYMTVLFSDVEGFTTLSEQISPEDISALLNEYLTSMVQCVTQNSGTLDKFIGDAVMALWNAPGEQKEHAFLACETALLMMKELEGLRKKWQEEQKPLINTRIGINTGDMIVGNMGSKDIFDYTVLGAEVNVAARLEPLNKDFGTRITVSESTRTEAEKYLPEMFVFRRLARVQLKGRNKPLEVHELVGLREDTDEKVLGTFEEFEKGLDLFINSEFAEAKKIFQSVLERIPHDGPSKTYISLCESYEKNPPSNDWRGVYVQESK